ncbi:exopolysaccharide transport family protein [Bosea sp. BK604]|uniref:GumC family protein n=1 Tax=Bosea sp. BK604 TaxID=2512180 RepID=UPI0010EBF788|nr:exopolysaccharide transport family protein [Bosea sp. BK604]TCR68562.1 uncharacterized protein involved in exopolysaccharide biosynthesis [Bosea sp. BK604]
MPETYRRQSDGTVEIAELWRILWHRRYLILGVAGLLVAATLVYGLITPATYTASAQLLIDPRDRIVVSNDVNPNTVSPDGGIAQIESQTSVIQSTSVLLRAIADTKLTQDREFNGAGFLSGLFGFLRTEEPARDGKLSQAETRTLANLRRKVSVRRADKVFVVDVVVTTQDPDKSARLANAIADAYLADQAEARSQGAREASEALTARLAEQRKRVEAAENAIERYRAEHNLTAASGRLISEQQLTEISTQLSAAQARSALLKAQVEQVAQQRRSGGLAGGSTEAMQSAVVAKLREQESTLVQREADLQSQLGPRHPSIAAARSQLAHVRQLITTELERIQQATRADYDRALANEKLLSAKLDGLTQQTQTSDQASVRLRELQRDLEAVRAVYANFLLRAQETREQATIDTTNARIIGRAQPPQQKSWPPLGLLLAGAGGLGLGLGAGIALIREYASPTLLSPKQAEALIGAPVIGLLPPERKPGGKPKSVAGAKAPLPPDAHVDGIAGLALLRLMEMRGAAPRNAARSILLISTDGDSSERLRTALLLADAAADQGERVLLVDADVDKSQESGAAGLLDVLRGECGLDVAIHFESTQDVALMPKGRQKAAPQKVDGRAFASRMLAEASRHFDIVVMDGGVLTQNIKIAPLVATVEHIVLVGQLYVTQQNEIGRVVEAARLMGRTVTAAVLIDSLDRR